MQEKHDPANALLTSLQTRRLFLKNLGKAGLGVSMAGMISPLFAQNGDSEKITRISIIHTTDLHGHILPTEDYDGNPDLGGLARCASLIQKWRSENPNHILVDVGDLYQGTEPGFRTQGKVMVDLVNQLNYDAWVIGNHEFNWGMEPLAAAIQNSNMPVLGANIHHNGKHPSYSPERVEKGSNPFQMIQPYFVKNVAGIKIGFIGLTTPGIPFWDPPRCYEGLTFADSLESLAWTLPEVKSAGAKLIVLLVHQGYKIYGDDFANQVRSIARQFPELTLIIAGHTHQNFPSMNIGKVAYTQANYWGIHLGRVDLEFDSDSRKLLNLACTTHFMSSDIPLDGNVLSTAQPVLENSEKALATVVGELADPLSIERPASQPSEIELLIAASIREALHKKEIKPDIIVHGILNKKSGMAKGAVTVADCWRIIPYENTITIGVVNGKQLREIIMEVYAAKELRSFVGLEIKTAGRKVAGIKDSEGNFLSDEKNYSLALNTFDAMSAGQKFPVLSRHLRTSGEAMREIPIQTRSCLIDFFQRREKTDLEMIKKAAMG